MEKIVLKAQELYDYVDKLKKDKNIEAVEVSIYDYENEDGETKKYFDINIIECGGNGLSMNDESLEEMTPEEILRVDNPDEITEKDIFLEQLMAQMERQFDKETRDIKKNCHTCADTIACFGMEEIGENVKENCPNWQLDFNIYQNL